MRIALVTPEFPNAWNSPCGGLGQYLQRLVLALNGAGHEAEVFVPVVAGVDLPDGVHPVDKAWSATTRWVSRMTLHRFAHPIDMFMQSVRLNDALVARHRVAPFDVVQYSHLAAVALASPSQIPAVIRLSGWNPLWRKAGDRTVGGLQGRLAFHLEVRALRRAQVVYAPSRHLAGLVGRQIRREIEVQENPFVADCAPADGPAMVTGRYLLTFGQINRLKGMAIVARIAPRILAADGSLQWVLVGSEQESGCVASIRAGAGAAADRIIHLPHLPHPELYRLIAGAEVVVLPSLIDNLPNTCLEAMALGACVVGTRPTGMEQVIDDGRSGFLAHAGDADSLAHAVIQALSVGVEARRMIGMAATERIRAMRPEIILPRLLVLYERARQVHASIDRGGHARS